MEAELCSRSSESLCASLIRLGLLAARICLPHERGNSSVKDGPIAYFLTLPTKRTLKNSLGESSLGHGLAESS